MDKYPEEIFIANIIASITGKPDGFEMTRSVDERGVLVHLLVDKSIAGRVIGESGNTAKALRTLLHALGRQNKAFYSLSIDVREDEAGV